MQKINTEKEATQILRELEDVWKKFNAIYEGFNSRQWEKQYGVDWKFSDQPYHLAFFDRMCVQALLNGARASKQDIKSYYKTLPQLNKWNESEFKKRPRRYTPQKSLDDFKKSQEQLRQIVHKKTHKMDEMCWLPLFFGWVQAKDVLNASLIHSVGEYMELCMRVKRPIDVLPSSCRRREEFMMRYMALSVNKKAARGKSFTLVWNFTGRGAASWTIKVEDGVGTLTPGKAKNADIILTLSLVSFEKMLRHMKNPMLMMLTGEIKVEGFMKLPVFMKLFPQP